MIRFKLLSLLLLVFYSTSTVYAQDIYEDKYQWKIPGGKYIDPVSFFSLHGYVNAVYAGESPEWKQGNFNGIGMPGQVILPNTNTSSFNNDVALWLSSELSEKASVIMELHLVNNPSGVGAAGPGGITFVLTEANLRYKLIKNYLAVSAGTFWSVFGIQNQDWLGAQNLFTTIPLASGAYVTHYNERGLRLDGSFAKGDWGLNYVFSVGNGFNAWDISGYNSFDSNNNKTINGRVSVFPGFGEHLNIGISYGQGLLFERDPSAASDTKQFYDNSFKAFGADITAKWNDFGLRSYLIQSEEILINNQTEKIFPNTGFMAELSFKQGLGENSKIDAVIPKIRFDQLDKSMFVEGTDDVYTTISFGLNFQINSNFLLSLDHNWITEKNFSLDNNRMVARVSANF